jgi:DNA-binding CsgD family transcriptional regulator
MLEEGIRYCEERDLDSWTAYMSAFKARLLLRAGKWDEARRIAEGILANADHSAIVRFIALVVMATLRMRRGEPEVSPLLAEARTIAFTAGELQRIIPLMVALLEYEWIMGERYADDREIERTVEMIGTMGTLHDSSEFAFWLRLARGRMLSLEDMFMGWRVDGPVNAGQAADFWGGMGCDYYRALMLFSQGEAGQREALGLVREMGAVAVYRRMSMILRAAGVKNLPRGARESTKSNVALLTGREIDVLRLLKEGMKNKEIAAKLFISPKTVDHHISALLLKLDVESRAKAVNEAMRRGILEK